MKTAYSGLAAFWAWMIWSMPSEMAIIGRSFVHVFEMVLPIALVTGAGALVIYLLFVLSNGRRP